MNETLLQPADPPGAASLDNPLYYLENARTLISWVRQLHADLLTEAEIDALDALLNSEKDVQALLIRMVMRTQLLYRADQLSHYKEIRRDTSELLTALAELNLVELEPAIDATQLRGLLNRQELHAVHNRLISPALPKSATKARLGDAFAEAALKPRSLSIWLNRDTPSAALLCQPLFDRLRLMFFGNLRQDWSEFVVTELGYYNYEAVELNNQSRAFHQREEVDQYLALDAIYQQRETLDLNQRIDQLQAINPTNDWIAGRHARLLFSLGQEAERAGETDTALNLYHRSNLGDALIRELRVMEKSATAESVQQRLNAALEGHAPHTLTPLHQLSVARVESRIAKKLGMAKPAPKRETPAAFKITIPKPEQCVELGAAEALANPSRPVAYVENCLINALFGLLLWDALYAPVRGAFFHPFQSQPADLYRATFRSKRDALITASWVQLEDGRYVETIRQRYQQKQGITNAFVHWSVITPQLLELALRLIPAAHLRLIFERLLSDLRTHRSGFPDLIQFNLDSQSYQLIEVKGPGDRLQDNQKLWLDYFVKHEIPCSVCWVSWSVASD